MKHGSLVNKVLLLLVTAGVLGYFGAQIYGYVSDPFSTTLTYTYQVENVVELSGFVAREEQVIAGDTGGPMRMQRSEGERVSVGGVVATVFADQASLDRQNEMEALQERIEQLEYAQESMLGAEVMLKLDNQISQTLLDYRAALAEKRLDIAEDRGQELRSLVLKRDYTYSGTEDLSGQISELNAQLKTLQSQSAGTVRSVRASRSGLFSAVVDGYESVLTPESILTLTPGAMDALAAEETPANTGKLILGDSWYYVSTLSAADAETLRTFELRKSSSESLSLRFTKNVDRDLEVTLLSVSEEENGRCVAVFQGKTYLQELTLLRRQSAEIVLGSLEGMRVPRAALRVSMETVTETDEKTGEERTKEVSVTGVYCVSGAKAVFKPVEVLYSGEDYAVVQSTGETEKLKLRSGDEVIVAAKDLYDGKVVA